MTLNTSGALLEGMRFSTGNNVYTFPPDNLVLASNQNIFSSISERAEYVIVSGTLNPSKKQLEIADPDLVFYWSRNEPGVTRFDYDSYSGRWMPMPGSCPRSAGGLSNTSRLSVPVPDPAKASGAPFSLYLDDNPRVEFLLSFIGSNDFTNPILLPGLTVEINDSGFLNFSSIDIASNEDKPVSYTGQNFTPRTHGRGDVGVLPDFASTDYRLFMNPRPASGQIPRIRIGYGPHLVSEEVSSESLLTPPPAGTVRWSADTGRLKFSVEDVSANSGETIYYDGVFLGSEQFDRHTTAIAGSWPSVSFNILSAVGAMDIKRFIVFAEKDGETRRYFSTTTYSSSSAPTSGWCYVDLDTGNFYLSSTDVSNFSGWTFWYLDALLNIGAVGVSVQMRRSAVNRSGEASVPDFSVVYEVVQTLSDNLNPYPFAMLPTVPTVDEDLRFQIDVGTGSFVGDLVDSSDATKRGYGYLLDLSQKQLKFTARATPRAYSLPKDQSSIKLDGAALVNRGVEVKRDGVLLSASEFDLDSSSGLIEFVEPIGEGEVGAVEVSGNCSGSVFTTTSPIFSSSDSGKRLLVYSGENSGIYDILSVESSTKVSVSPAFVHSVDASASVRSTDEIIADRLWTPVVSTPKKFSIYRSPNGPSGAFTKLDVGSYSVKQYVGQVSVSTAALPGESFRIEYVSLDSEDGGVTVTSTQRVETALFKISQEDATFSVGSKVLTFNANGKTVNTEHPIVLYVEGVTQDPNFFVFTAPGTITVSDAIPSGPVTVDYWVEEAIGGETIINLQHYPVDYDSLKVLGPIPGQTIVGDQSMQVSGDQTATLKARCALLLEDQDMLYISESSYDPGADVTKVLFSQGVLSDSENVKVTGTINTSRSGNSLFFAALSNPPYLVAETNAVEIFVSGTNSVRVHGDVSALYKAGTVMDFDGDPYWIRGSKYDTASDITTIGTAGSARRNYITPVVKRSVRPVLNPSSEFSTLRPAHISRGFTLAKMGSSSSVLQQGVDYDLGDDGVIKLKLDIAYGDVLRAMYVARVMQPSGTVFEFNFAREIAPDGSNGLAGQKLVAHYNLLAPDTFFYRVETVVSMLPEAKETVVGGDVATSSGPNIVSTPSQQTKDSGLPSPWYYSAHYRNVDVVVQRFLLYYNDLINMYEDLFEYVDGRHVGGTSGRFRYDGVLGRVVSTYDEIKNDIDDSVVLYNSFSMSSAFPPTQVSVPVYGKMSDTNNLSRIFPTTKTGAAFIGNVSTATTGQQVGSYDIENIVSTGTTVTSRASAFFTSSLPITGGTQFTLDSSSSATELTNVLTGGSVHYGTNGDSSSLTPPFTIGQKIQAFDLDEIVIGEGEITDVDPVDAYVVFTTIKTSVQIGSLAQTAADFEGDANMQHMYTPGVDYLVSSDSGQIVYFKTPTGSLFQNNPLQGNEIIHANITFGNTDLAPFRFPALDGLELDDSGHQSVPRTRSKCELRCLIQELSSVKVGSAKYPIFSGPLTDVESNVPLKIGDEIQFVNGPNNGFSTTVTNISSGNVHTSPPLPYLTPSESDFVVGVHEFESFLGDEVMILNKELEKLGSVMGMFGTTVTGGSGIATSTSTWQDASANFSETEGMLLRVMDGPSMGLYRIDSASGDTITISPSPYSQFILGIGQYLIVEPWPFLNESEFQFVSWFHRSTLEFLQSTTSWLASPTLSGFVGRMNDVERRRRDLNDAVSDSGSLTSLLRNGDNLYDTRYLWINQRTNRETGLVQLQARAYLQGVITIAKVTENQRKRFLMESVASVAGLV
jgi:hypothetical protein